MGFLKNRDIEQREFGFSAPQFAVVCDACVAEPALKRVIEEEAFADYCDFCGREAEEPIAADTDLVLRHIGRSLQHEWEAPLDVPLFYDSEYGWVGEVFDFQEVLAEEGDWPFANDNFESFVLEAFRESEWCSRDQFAFDEAGALKFSWKLFAETVKHEARFLFLLLEHDSEHDDPGEPVRRGGAMLEELGQLLNEFSLIADLPVTRDLYRVRVHSPEEHYSTAKDLGAPPTEKASQNRMSPAGISMFYAAEDAETAITETVDPSAENRIATVAEFHSRRDCRVVDLTRLEPIPSIFDDRPGQRDRRPRLRFLHGFRRDLSARIERDDRIHIEYVPTQVVCEFLRHLFSDSRGRPTDGLIYESSQRPGGRNVVLFVDHQHCLEQDEHPPLLEGLTLELRRSDRREIAAEG